MTMLAAPPSKPHTPAPSPVVAQRLVVAAGNRRPCEIVIGAHRIDIDGRSVALDDIEGVAYSTRAMSANLVQRRIRRRIWIGTPDGPLTVELGARRFGHHDADREAVAFDALVRLLHERVEPRLRRLRVAQLCTGEELRFASLTLAPAGLTIAGSDGLRSWPWRSIPLAELRGDHIAIVDAGHDARVHCRVDATVPDAVMLPELLWSASAALI